MAGFFSFLKKQFTFGEYINEVLHNESSFNGTVSRETAFRVSAVLSCIRLLCNGVAQVPLRVYRNTPEGKVLQTEKEMPLVRLLQRRPNAFQTPFEFKSTITMHRCLGNAYVYIGRVGREISALIPLNPDSVTLEVSKNYEKTFKVQRPDGSWTTFDSTDIWHLPGYSWDGLLGHDLLRLASNAIGLAESTEQQHIRLHRNGLNPGAVITYPKVLNADQYLARRKWLESGWSGVAATGKAMILDDGATLTSLKMSGVDAQHLETRKYQVEEICRFFGVNPIMIGHDTKTQSYSSVEQMFLAHIIHTLSPLYTAIEESADVYLLTKKQQDDGFYTAFDTDELMRGAMSDVANYLNKLVLSGIITRNEARKKIDLNGISGLDEPLTPANVTSAGKDSALQ